MKKIFFLLGLISIFFLNCQKSEILSEYHPITGKVPVKLTSEYLKTLSATDRQLLNIFVQISVWIDTMYAYENYGDLNALLKTISDTTLRKKILINFGPWNNFTLQPLLKNIGKKPEGANYYPKDMTKQEFLNFNDPNKYSHYSFIRRDSNGNLISIPYHQYFKKYVDTIAKLFYKAAQITNDTLFAQYLRLKAQAFLTDNYDKSDSIWIKLTNTKIDFLVGPCYIETDKLFYIKADHLAVILIKDTIWSKKVKKYNIWLKFLQKALPVPDQYKEEEPSDISGIYVYDAVYFAGAARSPAMLISLVQPLDSKNQLKFGIKNLQFKNIIQYKFDKVVKPIAQLVLNRKQVQYVNSYAFFVNTLLWEIGGSLGIKNTLNGKGTVRQALKETYIITEYIKNNLMSMYLAERLAEVDEIQNDLKENYATFVVDLIRGLRFGIKDNYSIANLIVLNYLIENNALKYEINGKIVINFKKLYGVITDLLQKIIIIQGDGDYQKAKQFIKKYDILTAELQKILSKINQSQIPKDIYPIQAQNF